MAKKLLEGLEQAADRRGFLSHTAAAAAALVTGVFGFSKPAEALVSYRCCSLCFSPSGCSSCACWWSWSCCMSGGCPCYYCKECFKPGFACIRTCNGVKCSSAPLICACAGTGVGDTDDTGAQRIPIC